MGWHFILVVVVIIIFGQNMLQLHLKFFDLLGM